jgi:[ribosomal protein S18]-alanine N-acetyltransferase
MVCKKEKINISRLKLTNVSHILKLQESSDENSWGKESLIHLLKDGSGSGLILYKGGLGAGYIIARTIQNDLEILSLAVLPERQRMGLGSILFKEMEKCIISGNRAKLFLEVNNNNRKAKSFYKSMGLCQIKVLEEYYRTDEGKEDGLMLSKVYI